MDGAVVLAFESFIEREPLGGIPGAVAEKFENGLAVPFPVTNFDGVDQPRTRFGINREAVDDNINGLRKINVQQSLRRRKFMHASVLIEPVEAPLLKIEQRLPERFLRRGPQ